MKMAKVFNVEYFRTKADDSREFSHRYSETWNWQDGLYCPRCKAEEVWANAVGDFYVGEQHICAACGTTFQLPSGAAVSHEDADLQRLLKLRGA